MPRRKPKHLIKPGEVRNPNGRPRGSVNEINQQIREAFAMLLHSQLPQLEDWLTRAAQKDPIKAADLMLRISERFLPSLSRTEITSADGQAFTPITINLPSLPKFTIGEGAPAEALLIPPGEDTKELPEPNPTFMLPKFELSPNILRDIEETGGGAPNFNDSITGDETGSPSAP